MNDVSLNPEIVELEAEMEYEMPQYPVIPNPEGEPTEEITKMEIDDVIYEVTDAEARATLPTKVDKVEGKGLSTNDYDNTDKAIVDGVTSALDGKVDKVQGKGLSTNDFTDAEKTIVDETPSALESKADKNDTYTKSEVDSALNNKVNKDGDKVLSDNNYSDTDKTKLDGIEAEANKTVVDNSITSTSTNPVESKAIYSLLNDLLPEATATGNPIAITNASGLNAKSLKVELEPIQDLHGYDSPWVGGGGKNKLPKGSDRTNKNITFSVQDNGEVIVTGTATATTFWGTRFTIPAGTYILNGCPTGGSMSNYLVDIRDAVGGSGISGISADSGNGSQFTLSDTLTAYVNIRIASGYSAPTGGLKISPMIRLSSESDGTFAPYSNICPISGRTQTTVSVNNEDTTIQFGQTVYGGEVDVTNGGTSDKWKTDLLNSFQSISYDGTYHRFGINVPLIKKAPVRSLHIYSEIYQAIDDGRAISNVPDFSVYNLANDTIIYVHDSRFSDVNTFKQAIADVHICYKLATPTEINTPSNEISLNKANNTLTADGDMELIYSKTPQ